MSNKTRKLVIVLVSLFVVAFTWWNVSDYLSYEPTFCSKYTIIINLYAIFIWLKFLYGEFKKRGM